ncbi:MAG: hypothetical protein J6L89_08870 [Clostridia bacterium]|nr:hypothetical protein [Clostridia bacterium]
MIGFTIVLRKRKKARARSFGNRKKKMKIKKYYFLPLVFLVVFAIGASFFTEKEDDSTTEEITTANINVFKEINDYSEYYMPVVMNNFTSYEKGEEIENSMLIKLGIWSLLCTGEANEYASFNGKIHIPAEKVEERIIKLFSGEIRMKKQSIKEATYSIGYDNKTDCFIIPTIAFSPEYTPSLESVAAKNSKTILTVGCLKSDSYKQDSSGNTVAPEAEKRIIIILQKGKNGYFIQSISEE